MDYRVPSDVVAKGCVLQTGVSRAELSVAGVGFEATLRELGVTHIAAFVRPQVVGKESCPTEKGVNVAAAFAPGEEFAASIQVRGRSLPRVRARVRQCEQSWIRGYKCLVVADILAATRNEEEAIESVVMEERERASVSVKPQTVRPASPLSPLERAEAVRVTFPARRGHSAVFRALCECLAQEAGFSQHDAFLIKLAADEVFTNAVIHGSERYGVSRVHADIVVDKEGITVVVRDEGGRPFNYHRHQAGRDESQAGSARSGLDVIDKVMDNWTVRTEMGRYTEVIFRKKRVNRG